MYLNELIVHIIDVYVEKVRVFINSYLKKYWLSGYLFKVFIWSKCPNRLQIVFFLKKSICKYFLFTKKIFKK